jgi:hypothetical protein
VNSLVWQPEGTGQSNNDDYHNHQPSAAVELFRCRLRKLFSSAFGAPLDQDRAKNAPSHEDGTHSGKPIAETERLLKKACQANDGPQNYQNVTLCFRAHKDGLQFTSFG